ncbi:MAG: TM2 domain-containing protein [Pseudomonadota bacterium]|uniref:TM2 domain-containing protein n=1 Tax=Thermithiobacillus tepidarius TaxID=929 RepID=UPI00048EE8E5|nr:TM2 domain-containing protein [Thermithiobacillus tepidarius]
MTKTWKKMDLEGGGLQSLQLRLLRAQRKPAVAYALWLLFPLGLHRWYLKEPWFWLYPAASAAALGLFAAGWPLPGAVLLGAMAAAALYDLSRIADRISQLNKELRKTLWLSKSAPPAPPGYQGRYADYDQGLHDYVSTKEREQAGHVPVNQGKEPDKTRYGAGKRAPSFAEQERMLAELARLKQAPKKDDES